MIAGVNYLRSFPQIEEIGLIGHSEGGTITSLVAAQSDSISFIIILGSPGLKGVEYNLQFKESMSRAMGATDDEIEKKLNFQKRILTIIIEEKNSDSVAAKIDKLFLELDPNIPEKNREIYIYNFHNYSEVVKLNVDEELQKGENYYSLPELFHQVRLGSPIDAEPVYSSSTTFTWYGNATNYELCYSDNPEFGNYKLIFIGDTLLNNKLSYLFGSMSLGFIFVGSVCFRKKKHRAMLLIIILISFLTSCSLDTITSPYHPSEIEYTATVDDLQPTTVYYWKVIAIGEDGINSESEVQVFVTGDF